MITGTKGLRHDYFINYRNDCATFCGIILHYRLVWAMNIKAPPSLQQMLSLCVLALGDLPMPPKVYCPSSDAEVAKAIRAKQQELKAINFRKRLPRNHPDRL